MIKVIYNKDVDSEITVTVIQNKIILSERAIVKVYPTGTSVSCFCTTCDNFLLEVGYTVDVISDDKLQFKIEAE